MTKLTPEKMGLKINRFKFPVQELSVSIFFSCITLPLLIMTTGNTDSIFSSQNLFLSFILLFSFYVCNKISLHFFMKEWNNKSGRHKENNDYKSIQFDAIFRATQVLAHEVKKPFSIVSIGLTNLKKAGPNEAITLVDEMAHEFELSKSTVSSLLQDLLEAGSNSPPNTSKVKAEKIFKETITQVMKLYPKTESTLEWSFQLEHYLQVEKTKFSQVCQNILSNAFQAIEQKGQIWVRTRKCENQPNFAEIVFGNSGSFIESHSLRAIFDYRFTKGKLGGSGLGLWICKKIAKAHGGNVTCQSQKTQVYPDGYVEFTVTLPIAPETYLPEDVNLPTQTPADLSQNKIELELSKSKELKEKSNLLAKKLEEDILIKLGKRSERLSVLIVDPEISYQQYLTNTLMRSKQIFDHLTILLAGSSTAALNELQTVFLKNPKETSFVAIMDHELKNSEMDGNELTKKTKEMFPTSFVCMHSHRMGLEEQRNAFIAGADVFLPKPLGQIHLLQILHQSLQLKVSKKIAFAFIDDNLIFRRAWKRSFPSCVVKTFENPKSFWQSALDKEFSLDEFAFLVTDLNFDNQVQDGLEFAKEIYDKRQLPIFLSTNSHLDSIPEHAFICAKISKDPLSLDEINAYIQNWKRKLEKN